VRTLFRTLLKPAAAGMGNCCDDFLPREPAPVGSWDYRMQFSMTETGVI
jgi:hypothetical protein